MHELVHKVLWVRYSRYNIKKNPLISRFQAYLCNHHTYVPIPLKSNLPLNPANLAAQVIIIFANYDCYKYMNYNNLNLVIQLTGG